MDYVALVVHVISAAAHLSAKHTSNLSRWCCGFCCEFVAVSEPECSTIRSVSQLSDDGDNSVPSA